MVGKWSDAKASVKYRAISSGLSLNRLKSGSGVLKAGYHLELRCGFVVTAFS
jgi:hypothetical protein